MIETNQYFIIGKHAENYLTERLLPIYSIAIAQYNKSKIALKKSSTYTN